MMQALPQKWGGRDSPGHFGAGGADMTLADSGDGPADAWLEARKRGRSSRHPIRTAEFLIGRAEHCHLVLRSDHRYISREHAVITRSNGLYWISDLSINGTWLNGKRLLRLKPERLRPGDIIAIEDWELVFHVSLGHAADAP